MAVQASFEQDFGCNLVSGAAGLGAQKNFERKYMCAKFKADQLILHFDDDVFGLLRAGKAKK